jgi:hypothetical protein
MTSVIALSILGGGTALAANPNWVAGHGTDSSLAATLQPASGASSSSVAAGEQVGFFEWLRNDDTSNIAQLFVTATTTPAATVVGGQFTIVDANQNFVRGGACPSATPFDCPIGSLNAGNTVYVVAAFTTRATLADGSTQSVLFEFNSTGAPPGKNNSHGDAKQLTDSVLISKNGDASGDFNFTGSSLLVQDDQKTTGRNAQATSVELATSLVGGSVNDSPANTTPCDPSFFETTPPSYFSCAGLTSLSSIIEVGNGKTFSNPNGVGTPAIKVIISFAKSPDQLGGANPFVYHYWTTLELVNGVATVVPHAELITAPCTFDQGFPTNQGPCLVVGKNQVTTWLTHNGNMRS